MTPDHTPSLTSRRTFLTTAALGGVGIAAATVGAGTALADTTGTRLADLAAAKNCLALTPTQEIGPFYVDYGKVRSHIRAGQAGIRLQLHIKVIDITTCKPLPNAALDIWHANALGVYSDEQSENTVGKTYLRGIQLTDKHGRATFHTIMPGWYEGRVNHIHTKVRLKGTDKNNVYSGGSTTHIGQMFFPQAVNNTCARIAPYTSNQQSRITNATDRVYTQQHGSSSRLRLTGSSSKGYVGHITLGVKG